MRRAPKLTPVRCGRGLCRVCVSRVNFSRLRIADNVSEETPHDHSDSLHLIRLQSPSDLQRAQTLHRTPHAARTLPPPLGSAPRSARASMRASGVRDNYRVRCTAQAHSQLSSRHGTYYGTYGTVRVVAYHDSHRSRTEDRYQIHEIRDACKRLLVRNNSQKPEPQSTPNGTPFTPRQASLVGVRPRPSRRHEPRRKPSP